MVDKSGDHPTGVEHSTHANISPLKRRRSSSRFEPRPRFHSPSPPSPPPPLSPDAFPGHDALDNKVEDFGDHPKDVGSTVSLSLYDGVNENDEWKEFDLHQESTSRNSTPTPFKPEEDVGSKDVGSTDVSVPLSLDDGFDENDEWKEFDLYQESTSRNSTRTPFKPEEDVGSKDVGSRDMSVPLSLVDGVNENDEWKEFDPYQESTCRNLTRTPFKPEEDVGSTDVSVPLSLDDGFDENDEWKEFDLCLESTSRKSTRLPSKPEDPPYDSDSDDEFGKSEECARMFAAYNRQVNESEGFEIDNDVYPGRGVRFEPLPFFKENKNLYDRVKEMALQALKTFKDDSGKQYELVDVEKLVWTTDIFYLLTITGKQLDAKDDDEKTIQVITREKFRGRYSIKLCRLKPDRLNPDKLNERVNIWSKEGRSLWRRKAGK